MSNLLNLQKHADIIIPEGGSNKVAIDIMTTKIQSLVSKNSNFIVKEDEIYGKPKQYPMTQEGYEKLEQELEELKRLKDLR